MYSCKNFQNLRLEQIHVYVKHYDNTPMQYTVIFDSCKNANFQMKNCDIFLIFAQNIDCGYSVRRFLQEYPQSMFRAKNKNTFTCISQVLLYKSGCKGCVTGCRSLRKHAHTIP